jgi:hypothetical protein
LGQQINLSVGTTHTMLHKNLHLYSYRVTIVQELKPADCPRRLHLCNWIVDNVGNNVKNTSNLKFYRLYPVHVGLSISGANRTH